MDQNKYFAELTKHMIYDMSIAQAMGRGCNSYAHYDIEFLEYGHELGMRVWHSQEEEDLGYGPLFDLQYELYMKGNE